MQELIFSLLCRNGYSLLCAGIDILSYVQEFVILMKRKTAAQDNEEEGNDDIEEAFKVFDRNGDG